MKSPITYSPAYTLVPTYECFNRCSYCNFRVDPGQDNWLSLSTAEQTMKRLGSSQVVEILVLSGEVHPRSSRRKIWLQRIKDICQLALSLGFLPHTNAGPLSFAEMESLGQVNVSMGLMLEQITPKFLKTVHANAPSKNPVNRIQQLEQAGKLKIPFTTGLLIGIGETDADRLESLEAIAKIHQKWGHIQEVILQPHSLGNLQTYQNENFDLAELPNLIASAKKILPNDIKIQIPPNLIRTRELLIACLDSGANDLGGISPKDEVNPDYPHLTAQYLQEMLANGSYELTPRLPVYPQHFDWLSPSLQKLVHKKSLKIKKLG